MTNSDSNQDVDEAWSGLLSAEAQRSRSINAQIRECVPLGIFEAFTHLSCLLVSKKGFARSLRIWQTISRDGCTIFHPSLLLSLVPWRFVSFYTPSDICSRNNCGVRINKNRLSTFRNVWTLWLLSCRKFHKQKKNAMQRT